MKSLDHALQPLVQPGGGLFVLPSPPHRRVDINAELGKYHVFSTSKTVFCPVIYSNII